MSLSTLRIAAFASLTALAGVMAYTSHRGVDTAKAAAYRERLRAMRAYDAAIDHELLECRAGAVRQFDGLVALMKTRQALRRDLEEAPGYLGERGVAEVARAVHGETIAETGEHVGGLEEQLAKQDELIERFKTHQAVLRNSVRYLPTVVRQLTGPLSAHEAGGPLSARLNALLTDVLLFHDFGDPERGEEVIVGIEALSNADDAFLGDRDRKALSLLPKHAELILRHKKRIDELLAEIDRIPLETRIGHVSATFERHHAAARELTQGLRLVSFVLALITVLLGASFIILRTKRTARALQRAKSELETINAALEVEKDKQKELSELKSRFVSMTSHEFRTPLTLIASSAELLELYGERWNEGKRAKHFDKIKTAARQMKRMLDAVLLVGKADAGMLRFEPRPVDVRELVADVVDELHMSLETTQTVEVNLDDEVSGAVLDERLFRHLLTNLLTNAMKYSPHAERVFLDVMMEGDELVIVVEDTGVGIAEEDLGRIFESYYRGVNVGTIKGTGLGLALVHAAVQHHDGTVDVESEVGEGTTFKVRLPVEASGRARPSARSAAQ